MNISTKKSRQSRGILIPYAKVGRSRYIEAVVISIYFLSHHLQMRNHALPSAAIDGTRQTFDLQTRFVTSQNPAQIKRNVLNSFGNVLMLPVTIIPRAVGAVGTVAEAVQDVSLYLSWILRRDEDRKSTRLNSSH